MSKNYIEEWLKDNDLSIDESFNVEEFTRNPYFIDEGYRLRSRKEPFLQISGDNLVMILTGEFKIEKIKPKTLMEQLNEQGFGYLIQVQGEITNVTNSDFAHGVYDKMIMQCNIFLTESEAKREAYRRKLEFEMQEWARENDCLGSFADGVLAFRGLNVYITRDTKIQVDDCQEKFIDKYDKYYNWEE